MVPYIDQVACEVLLHFTSLGEELERLAFAEKTVKKYDVDGTFCVVRSPNLVVIRLDHINV